jgi:nonribosomal peptide synthetase DhbF
MLSLRSEGKLPPLFCIHHGFGLSWCYARLVQYINPEYPIYGLQARHLTEPEYLPSTLENIANDYVNQIRKIQPDGPYHLIGWSSGGLVAFAIATILQNQGCDVAFLAVLDAYPPISQDFPISLTHEKILSTLSQHLGYDTETRDLEISHLAGELPINSIVETYENCVYVMKSFVPQNFTGNLVLFTSIEAEPYLEIGLENWKKYINGNIVAHPIPHRHQDLLVLNEPSAQIGRMLAIELEKLNQRRK